MERPASQDCWSSASARWSQGPRFHGARAALSGSTSFPEATLILTRSLNQATGLAVPLEPLEKASASNLADIAEEMATSTEVQELVATLEQQFDALQAEQPDRVPSAEEIAAEFERFLAEREQDD